MTQQVAVVEQRTQHMIATIKSYGKAIETILPKHVTADRLMRVLVYAVRQNPALAMCEEQSFIASVISMSQLGMEVGPLGHAYLVPFNRSKKMPDGSWSSIKECTFILGYKGMLELVRNSGKVKSINADVIRQNDEWEYSSGLEVNLKHKPALLNRGEIIAYYVAILLTDGTPVIGFWSQEDVDRHIQLVKTMPGKKSEADGMWLKFRTEWAHKSIIRSLFKWLPSSVEDQRLLQQDGKILSIDSHPDGGLEINALETIGDMTTPVPTTFADQLKELQAYQETEERINDVVVDEKPEPVKIPIQRNIPAPQIIKPAEVIIESAPVAVSEPEPMLEPEVAAEPVVATPAPPKKRIPKATIEQAPPTEEVKAEVEPVVAAPAPPQAPVRNTVTAPVTTEIPAEGSFRFPTENELKADVMALARELFKGPEELDAFCKEQFNLTYGEAVMIHKFGPVKQRLVDLKAERELLANAPQVSDAEFADDPFEDQG